MGLLYAGSKQGSPIARRKTTAVRKLACFAFYIVICHRSSPYPESKSSSTHSRQMQTRSDFLLTLFLVQDKFSAFNSSKPARLIKPDSGFAYNAVNWEYSHVRESV